MKRSEVREFIRQGVVAVHEPDFSYTFGLLTEWDAKRDNIYPCIFNPSLEVSTSINTQSSPPFDSWQVQLYVVKKDRMDSVSDEYEPTIDECDLVAQKLMYQFRKIIDGYDLTMIVNSTRKPWIKKNADCCTGVLLEFIIENQDKTDVCP